MRTRFFLLFSIAVLLYLPALSQDQKATPAQPSPKEQQATIHIYRYKKYIASALKPSVYCDGKQVGRLSNGSVLTVHIAAGRHIFTSNDKNSGVDLDLNAGDEIYIRMDMTNDLWKAHGALTMMLPEQGRHDVHGLMPMAVAGGQ
jgi:hypothetical protein